MHSKVRNCRVKKQKYQMVNVLPAEYQRKSRNAEISHLTVNHLQVPQMYNNSELGQDRLTFEKAKKSSMSHIFDQNPVFDEAPVRFNDENEGD